MVSIVRLAPRRASPETIAALEDLLARAREGDVIGIQYVALQNGASYSADVTGACKTCRLVTIGAMRSLEAKLLDLP